MANIKKREVIVLLLSCALMVSSHGLLYNFYSIFLEEQGYSGAINRSALVSGRSI